MAALPVASFCAAPLGLLRASRAQGNFIEYAPMALILFAPLELSGASALMLHALGAGLPGGRVMHGISTASAWCGSPRPCACARPPCC